MRLFKRVVPILFLLTALAGCSGMQPKSPPRTAGDLESGKATFYAMKYQGRKTASGERFDQKAKTAAHRKLPFGTKVKVTNLRNGKSVVVRVNDRGPFVKGHIIDLSRSAFRSIGDIASGVIRVTIEVVE